MGRGEVLTTIPLAIPNHPQRIDLLRLLMETSYQHFTEIYVFATNSTIISLHHSNVTIPPQTIF